MQITTSAEWTPSRLLTREATLKIAGFTAYIEYIEYIEGCPNLRQWEVWVGTELLASDIRPKEKARKACEDHIRSLCK